MTATLILIMTLAPAQWKALAPPPPPPDLSGTSEPTRPEDKPIVFPPALSGLPTTPEEVAARRAYTRQVRAEQALQRLKEWRKFDLRVASEPAWLPDLKADFAQQDPQPKVRQQFIATARNEGYLVRGFQGVAIAYQSLPGD